MEESEKLAKQNFLGDLSEASQNLVGLGEGVLVTVSKEGRMKLSSVGIKSNCLSEFLRDIADMLEGKSDYGESNTGFNEESVRKLFTSIFRDDPSLMGLFEEE